jgi:hypothetical protein
MIVFDERLLKISNIKSGSSIEIKYVTDNDGLVDLVVEVRDENLVYIQKDPCCLVFVSFSSR